MNYNTIYRYKFNWHFGKLMKTNKITVVNPGSFDPYSHWYSKTLNAQIHPIVRFFMNMTRDQIIERYAYLNPSINKEGLRQLLNYKPKYMRWAGTDLMHATTARGKKEIVVIETNSCPSGQKSFPLLDENQEQGQYKQLIEKSFLPRWKKAKIKDGVTAVFYDKNEVENTGYAAAIADAINEPVYLVYYDDSLLGKNVRISSPDNIVEIKISGKWQPVRAIFRYVTQKPWNRLPLISKTFIFNSILSCIAGGRNKLMAAKAYSFLNAEIRNLNLKINMPETICDVSKNEIPLYISKYNYKGVIKIPYSNAGQGVFIIRNKEELDQFMEREYHYDKFIVQQLVGHYDWSSETEKGALFQVGTVPSKRNNSYVFDFRFIVHATSEGIEPLAMYSRRAAIPLKKEISEGETDQMLMTNLSYKNRDGSWGSDVSRLILMDQRDFNKLGLSIDDLIEGYIQSVLSLIAIDSMAQKLVSKKKKFKKKLFSSMNFDQKLIDELYEK